MSNITISGFDAAQLLVDETVQDPSVSVLIAASGYITYNGGGPVKGAVSGDSEAPWAITNLGTIIGAITPGGGPGIYLAAGGTITNGSAVYTAALIAAYEYAVQIDGGPGTVTNYATIIGTNAIAIDFTDGGSVVNGTTGDTAALISGNDGISISGGSANVVNFGTITGHFDGGVYVASGNVTNGSSLDTTARIYGHASGIYSGSGITATTVVNFGTVIGATASGVELDASGAVTNGSTGDTAARIAGGQYGVYIEGAATVANYATITTSGSTAVAGVVLHGGGSIVNGSTADTIASIYGYQYGVTASQAATVNNHGRITGARYGVALGNGGTVLNSGTISGTAAAILFGAGGADKLVMYPGAVFTGGVTANGTGGNRLELGYGYTRGTLSGLGTAYTGFGTLEIDSKAMWQLNATDITNAIALAGAGALLQNGGTLVASSLLSGEISLANGAMLELAAGVTTGNGVYFADGTSLLTVDATGSLSFDIRYFQQGDSIDFTNVGTDATASDSGNTLSIIQGGATVLTAPMYGLAPGATLSSSPDAGGNGIAITTDSQPAYTLHQLSTTIAQGTTIGNPAGIRAPAAVLGPFGTAWTLVNFGTVATYIQFGVYLEGGGSVTNGATDNTGAYIHGLLAGVGIGGSAGTVANYGTLYGFFGVLLRDGGSVTNGAADSVSAMIEGVFSGVVAGGVAATVTNYGTIQTVPGYPRLAPFLAGIYLAGGGSVTNGSALDTTALVAGSYSGILTGNFHFLAGAGIVPSVEGRATVTNFATITGQQSGVAMQYGGAVTNGATDSTEAYISGGLYGIQIKIYGVQIKPGTSGTPETVTNYGTIVASGLSAYSYGRTPVGILLMGGGTVTNGASESTDAYIYSAYVGVQIGPLGLRHYPLYAYSPTTVTNFGAIRGGTYGVGIGSGGTVVNAGYIGGGEYAVQFGSGGSDRLVVAPGALFSGAVAAHGTGGNVLELRAGGAGTLTDVGVDYRGFDAVLVDPGAGWTIANGITGAEGLVLNGAGLSLPGTPLDPATSFALEHLGGPDTLTLTGMSSQTSFDNTISNVSFLDGFVLPGFDFTADTASFDSGAHTLTVLNGDDDPVFSFGNVTPAAGETLHFITNGDEVQAAACYRRGTRILTASGERPIESLRIGDAVPTGFGGLRRIKWIGRRRYQPDALAGNRAALPVLIRAGALAEGVPARDLYVSPKHAMFLGGLLVPAEALLNDVSILQPPADGPVEYFHLEFDAHDVILAEAAAAESFVDCDSRRQFANAAEFAALYPGHPAPRWRFCARRIEGGPALEAIRRRIDALAGLRPAQPRPAEQRGALLGNLERADATGIAGWAFNPDQPRTPVHLEILGDGAVLATILANRHRDDLLAACLGSGRCAFDLRFDENLPPITTLVLRRTTDHTILAQRHLPPQPRHCRA